MVACFGDKGRAFDWEVGGITHATQYPGDVAKAAVFYDTYSNVDKLLKSIERRLGAYGYITDTDGKSGAFSIHPRSVCDDQTGLPLGKYFAYATPWWEGEPGQWFQINDLEGNIPVNIENCKIDWAGVVEEDAARYVAWILPLLEQYSNILNCKPRT